MSDDREDREKERQRAEEYLESKGWKKSDLMPGFWVDPEDEKRMFIFQAAWHEQYARDQKSTQSG